MAPWDPATWTPGVWALYLLGVLYLALFFLYYGLFHAAERRAKSGRLEDVRRYNRLVSGFPNAFYAKMMGRRRLEIASASSPGPPQEGSR